MGQNGAVDSLNLGEGTITPIGGKVKLVVELEEIINISVFQEKYSRYCLDRGINR